MVGISDHGYLVTRFREKSEKYFYEARILGIKDD